MFKKYFGQTVLILLPIISFFLCIWEIFQNPDKFQWDLSVYYQSPLALQAGSNPYEVASFVYPPLYLPLFKLFSTFFSLGQFYNIFLTAKIICFFILVTLWRKEFLPKIRSEVFFLFIWLSLYAAFSLDFQAGNISIFEALLIFIGFHYYMKMHFRTFSFFILVAASLKMTPLLFLLLLFINPSKKKTSAFFIGLGGFVLYGVINYIIYPDLSLSFLSQAVHRTTNEAGYINPSSYAFFTETFGSLAKFFQLNEVPLITPMAYVSLVTGVLIRSQKAWGKKRTSEDSKSTDRLLILFSILIYALVMPRMKDYAYILMIPSVLFIFVSFDFRVFPRWIFLALPLLIVPTTRIPPLFRGFYTEFWEYYPLAIVLISWWLFILKIEDDAKPKAQDSLAIQLT